MHMYLQIFVYTLLKIAQAREIQVPATGEWIKDVVSIIVELLNKIKN